jgi:hypothetical protein
MEAAGKIWIFSKTVFHSVWKTLLKTKNSLFTLTFSMLEKSVIFQPKGKFKRKPHNDFDS